MSAHQIPKDVWRKVLESFRSQPGHFAAAARAAGITIPTAKKLWEVGYPNDLDEEVRRPLKDVIADEQLEARARMAELEALTAQQAAELEASRRAAVAERARRDANASREEEARIIRVARGTVGDVLAGLVNSAKATLVVGRRMNALAEKWLEQQEQTPTLAFSPSELREVVEAQAKLASSTKAIVEAGHQAMQMERLLLGEPTAIIAHAHLQDITLEEAERRMAAAGRALERARRYGLLPAGVTVEAEPAKEIAPAVSPGPPEDAKLA